MANSSWAIKVQLKEVELPRKQPPSSTQDKHPPAHPPNVHPSPLVPNMGLLHTSHSSFLCFPLPGKIMILFRILSVMQRSEMQTPQSFSLQVGCCCCCTRGPGCTLYPTYAVVSAFFHHNQYLLTNDLVLSLPCFHLNSLGQHPPPLELSLIEQKTWLWHSLATQDNI